MKNNRQHFRLVEVVKFSLQAIPASLEQQAIVSIKLGKSQSPLAKVNNDVKVAIDSIPANIHIRHAMTQLDKKLDIIVQSLGLGESEVFVEQAINLSLGGCHLCTDLQVSEGDGVSLVLAFPRADNICIFARVLDATPSSVGEPGALKIALQFETMSGVAARILDQHMVARQRNALRAGLRD